MRPKSKDLAQIECHKCHKKGHYASNCGKTASAYTYKPTHKANIVEVNMIQIIEPVLRQESDDEKMKKKVEKEIEDIWILYDSFV